MTLTTGLILVAGVVLLGLLLQWAWVTLRARRMTQVELPTESGVRMEPTLQHSALDSLDVPSVLQDPKAAREPARMAHTRRSVRVDALIDAVATLTPEQALSGDLLLQHAAHLRRAGTKPMHLEAHSPGSGDWELPQPGQRYDEVQLAVQLVNRHGPLNEIEYSEFAHKVQGLADLVNAAVDLPDMMDEVARARELDSFCSQHDVQLIAHLQANSVAWSVGYLHQCAARHGFVVGPPGRLLLPSPEDGAPPVLVLSFDAQVAMADDPGQAALRQLVLSLDVSQTAREAEPFATWQLVARRLADDLDATLVDDAGAAITLHAFNAIGVELERHYQALNERELTAGSAVARRVFS